MELAVQKDHKIAVIGLGYVGLPLAMEFAKKYFVIGYDINKERIKELEIGYDRTKEADAVELQKLVRCRKDGSPLALVDQGSELENLQPTELSFDPGLMFSNNLEELSNVNIYIITVPTPIDNFKKPDLTPLLKASEAVGKVLNVGDIVVYESTVYPGCTEEDCVPVLERASGLKFNVDFFCGYSPERINPGDKVNTLTKIKKVTSGSTPEIANVVDELYASIISAGTHKAPSLKVAEASKAIENAQRDINISFVNELALIFDRIGIDTSDVIEAAATKWNFLAYKPGLVGGHCIGVDPYYLAHKADTLGYHPQVILAGRRVNDNMGQFIANKVIKLMIQKNQKIKHSKALVLGVTFKENCPDIRNSKVVDIVDELSQFGLDVDVFDPFADPAEVLTEYNISLLEILESKYDSIVLAVAHDQFRKLALDDLKASTDSIVFDTKAFFDREDVDCRL